CAGVHHPADPARRRRRLPGPFQPAGAALAPGRPQRQPRRPPPPPLQTPPRGGSGCVVDEVLALLATRPDLAVPLEGAEEFLAAEVVYAVSHEGARHLDDVLTPRTRISIETFDRRIPAAAPAARLMAGELGWDEARTADEVDHYLR